MYFLYTVKPVLINHLKRRQKVGFQDQLSHNAGQKYSAEDYAKLSTLIQSDQSLC